MDFKTACQILDLEPDFTPDDLKDAYNLYRQTHHPDKVKKEKFKKKLTQKFLEITEAYELLKKYLKEAPSPSLDDEDFSASIPLNPLGVPLDCFGSDAGNNPNIKKVLSQRTFIGIDFGTSTTVVSYVTINQETGLLEAEPIDINQYDEMGVGRKYHLVPTCIAWTGEKLLVGAGAAELKSEYQLGANIWFSFKMELGKDLGPQYYNSQLKGQNGLPRISRPVDAAAVFFDYLKKEIELFVSENQLPKEIYYSVSVPAAFEANQRQDLCSALKSAGVILPDQGIIDEPNAAFVSYFFDTFTNKSDLVGNLKEKEKNILVFDFGAGTCDISVLGVGTKEERFISKNKSISRFHALGGDNIDREIVRKCFINQFITQNGLTKDDFTSSEIKKGLIPRLQKAAEELKIRCCNHIRDNWDGINLEPLLDTSEPFSTKDLTNIKLKNTTYKLEKPLMSMSDFFDVMKPFLETDENDELASDDDNQTISIFTPIFNALEKAELENDALDLILFIGGSSQNPFVQNAVREYFGRFVETSDLGDIRTPVARGVALNSLMVNGLRCEVVKSITSEPIYILTKDDYLHEIIPSGTQIPSDEFNITEFRIDRDGQNTVSLPICVSNKNKQLQTIEVLAPSHRPFQTKDRISLKCLIDSNKLLNISGQIGNRYIEYTLINPLANRELTKDQQLFFKAERKLNESISAGNGRPERSVVEDYAQACDAVGFHTKAAEALIMAERIDSRSDFSTNICYHYAMAGNNRLSNKYGEIAYDRNPSAVNAFNLAVGKKSNGDIEGFERYMKIAYEKDDQAPFILQLWGSHLISTNNISKGTEILNRAFEILNHEYQSGTIQTDDLHKLKGIARRLKRSDIASEIDRKLENIGIENDVYSERNLVASTKQSTQKQRG